MLLEVNRRIILAFCRYGAVGVMEKSAVLSPWILPNARHRIYLSKLISTALFRTRKPIPIYVCFPSDVLRWQRPTSLRYPDAQTIQQIWELEQSLKNPTDDDNFSQRLYLLQSWTDLLLLEGFNFRPTSGSIVKQDLTPSVLRHTINAVLRQNDKTKAHQLLDAYLNKLDEASKDWFADGSPGDISKDEWKPISQIDRLESNGSVLLMHCFADSHPVNLHLSLPQTGGVRIYGDEEGYFKPADLVPLKYSPKFKPIFGHNGYW